MNTLLNRIACWLRNRQHQRILKDIKDGKVSLKDSYDADMEQFFRNHYDSEYK